MKQKIDEHMLHRIDENAKAALPALIARQAQRQASSVMNSGIWSQIADEAYQVATAMESARHNFIQVQENKTPPAEPEAAKVSTDEVKIGGATTKPEKPGDSGTASGTEDGAISNAPQGETKTAEAKN